MVTGLPTLRISSRASVLTLKSYKGVKGRAPSAPAEWSLDLKPQAPNPQFPALSNGPPQRQEQLSAPVGPHRAHTGGGRSEVRARPARCAR